MVPGGAEVEAKTRTVLSLEQDPRASAITAVTIQPNGQGQVKKVYSVKSSKRGLALVPLPCYHDTSTLN